jgi:DNA-directed RNA polymerase subunit H
MANTFETTEHTLVPNHVKLSKTEEKAFLEKHNFTKEVLPRILATDPAIGHLKPELGDIIKIQRKSPTAGQTNFYRVVASA